MPDAPIVDLIGDGNFETVFLRPVMSSAKNTELEARFVFSRFDRTGQNASILVRAALIRVTLAIATSAPIVLSASCPLLAWRDPVYIWLTLLQRSDAHRIWDGIAYELNAA